MLFFAEADEEGAEQREEDSDSVHEIVLAGASYEQKMDFSVVGFVKSVEAETETAHRVYCHNERVVARVNVAVRGDARAYVPDLVFPYDTEKVGKHAHFLFCGGVHHISEGSERPRRGDVAEISAGHGGVFVKPYELPPFAGCSLRLGTFVECPEAVINQIYVFLGAEVERAVERAVTAARDDKVVSFRRPFVRVAGYFRHRDVISRAEFGKEFIPVDFCGAAAHSVDDDKTFFHCACARL